MSRFAPVAPIQILEAMYDRDPAIFGEYHLLLAHHTVAHVDRFRRLFERIAADGEINPLVIMDNSVVECGGYVDFEMMQAAVAAVADYGIDVIPVLPDVMGKGAETREATTEAYPHWAMTMDCAGFMAVCQGETFADYCASVRFFADRKRFPLLEFLGIPRFLVQELGSRHQAVIEAVNRQDSYKIHLLGYSDDMYDDLQCSWQPGVYGIDSAVPLRVPGKFNFEEHVPSRPKDWFETAEATPQMYANLAYARQRHAQR